MPYIPENELEEELINNFDVQQMLIVLRVVFICNAINEAVRKEFKENQLTNKP